MKLSQAIRVGIRFLICLNILLALGSVWGFMRMAPAIEQIINRNEKSLKTGEEMLACLVLLRGESQTDSKLLTRFKMALQKASENITEENEANAVRLIEETYPPAFTGDLIARWDTISAIMKFSEVNREAMYKADRHAKQIGKAGAWGVVFMAIIVFLVGVLFARELSDHLLAPLEEIREVLTAHQNGDSFRRCIGKDQPKEIRQLYRQINDFLDTQITVPGARTGPENDF